MKNIPLIPQLHAIAEKHGETRIRQVIRVFYQKMHDDVMIGFFFYDKDLDLISERQSDFILRAMGVRESYTGKSPRDAHAALPPIRYGQFHRRIQILSDTLKQEGFSSREVNAWVQFERSFENTVVG